MNTNYCCNCGKAYGSSAPCRYCRPNSGSSIEEYMERTGQLETSRDLKHYYRFYKETYMTSIHPCHNCKYFMYHHINYCYKCGKKLQRSADTYGKFAKQCEGYRSGF